MKRSDRKEPELTPENIKRLVEKSGYPLEVRMQEFLRRAGWYVTPSAAYPDPDQNKSREIDLCAQRASLGGIEGAMLGAELVIECVANAVPFVFFILNNQDPMFYVFDLKIGGAPEWLPEKPGADRKSTVPYALGLETYHHYCKANAASQWCSFTQAGNEWKADHPQASFGCLESLCKAVDYFKRETDRMAPTICSVYYTFFYPVVVTQGSLYTAVSDGGGSIALAQTDGVRLRRSVASPEGSCTYAIDVVTERGFEALLHVIDSEMARAEEELKLRVQGSKLDSAAPAPGKKSEDVQG